MVEGLCMALPSLDRRSVDDAIDVEVEPAVVDRA